MARGLHWTLTFRSALKTSCRLYIYTNGYSGDPIILTGAETPFYWQEDDDNSLLRAIRTKTGYINVIEKTYGELDDLMPTSDTSHYVEFYYGSALFFTGYLQAKTFDNDWIASPREMSFPILSPTGLLSLLRFEEPTFAPDALNKVSIWSLLKQAITGLNAAYEKVIFPVQMLNQLQYVNSLVFCPFDNTFSVSNGTIYTAFAAETYYALFDALCNLYGWIMHDTPTAIVFDDLSRPTTQKTYYSIDIEDLGTGSTPEANVITTQSLLDLFQIYGKSHTVVKERGLSRLIMSYEGTFPKSTSLQMSHCVKYRRETVYNSFNHEAGGLMWLKCVGPEFSGTWLKYDGHLDWNSQSGSSKPTDAGVYPVSFAKEDGSQIKCLFYEPDSTWASDIEIFSMNYINHAYGNITFKMNMLGGTLLNLHEVPDTFKFKFKVSVDGLYFNPNTGNWDSNTPYYILMMRQNGDSDFTPIESLVNVPNTGTMKITLMSDFISQVDGTGIAMLAIESFEIIQAGKTFAEYESNEEKEEIVNLYGSSNAEENVTLRISFKKNNSNQISNDDGLATRQSLNQRLGNDKTIINVCLRQPIVQGELSMFGVFRFLSDTLYWNILSSSFFPRDDYYKIKLIH